MFLYCASSFKAEEKLTLAMVRRFLLSLKYIYKSHSKKRGQIQNTKIIH